ncbi:MAG: ATP-binding protein [Lachnospiraceae bacterium]|nr:ATP-binding protein [Lachnospiraceae bacterium]
MKARRIVRIIQNELFNFKNVEYGQIKYMNYSSVQNDACISESDIVGIYGQNGSGKTAMVEALDIVKHALSGMEIPYDTYEGILSDENNTVIKTVFFVEQEEEKYRVQYDLALSVDKSNKKIHLKSERLAYQIKGRNWKNEKMLEFHNPYYDEDAIINDIEPQMESKSIHFFEKTGMLKNLAVYCAQKNISIFFNELISKSIANSEKEQDNEKEFASVVRSLIHFGCGCFQVVKVNQLGAINNNIIPLNVHREKGNMITQGCLPLVMNGRGEVPEEIYEQLEPVIDSINIAIKSIIPKLSIELVVNNEEVKSDGKKYMQVEVYSNRDGKRFLTKYESEGIKRIISLLQYLIALYNSPEICLVVDELDSGIFEYLLGEMLGMMMDEAKGQLIFTSHNLRVLEKLPNKNIIYSTTNPMNRYIRLVGVEKNHNRRDFYIRTITLGGQKEELYDETELQAMGYAFRRAGRGESKVEIPLSDAFRQILEDDVQ